MKKQTSTKKHRPIAEIAFEIKKDWGKVSPFAEPYLSAMCCLTNVTDKYGFDDGKTIIMYFLSNAGSWRGEVAKRIKAELKQMVK